MGTGYAIDASCFRYVVPFRFDLDFNSVVALVDGLTIVNKSVSDCKPKWLRITAGQNKVESDLYDYVKNEAIFDSMKDSPEEWKYGCSWLYTGSDDAAIKEGKRLLDFKCFLNTLAKSPDAHKVFDLSMKNVGLILYRNGLGFFWYEIKIPENEMTLDDVKLFQYRIRELNRDILLWRKVNLEPDVGVIAETITTKFGQEIKKYLEPFSLGTWIARELSFIPVKFIAERQSTYPKIIKKAMASLSKSNLEIIDRGASLADYPIAVPDKAVLFTYCAFRGDDAKADCCIKPDLAYHLANGYKDSYHCSPEVVSDMNCPFSDVIWYATQEGAAFLSWPQDDNRTFFTSVILGKIRGDYFTLFLKVLFQSYSLLLYATRIQNNVYTSEESNTSERAIKSISSLYSEINTFITKSMATSVSHVHHQSEFYNYLKKQLRIQDDVRSVTAGLDSLYAIQREQRQKEEGRRILAEQLAAQDRYHEQQQERLNRDEQQKIRDDKFQAIMGLFALLSISSALADCFAFIANYDISGAWFEIAGRTKTVMLVCFALVGIVSIIAIFFSVRAIIDAFRYKKK